MSRGWINPEYRSGYFSAVDGVLNYLNTVDTEGKSALEVKKEIYREVSKRCEVPK
jgi:hypothetical protein